MSKLEFFFIMFLVIACSVLLGASLNEMKRQYNLENMNNKLQNCHQLLGSSIYKRR